MATASPGDHSGNGAAITGCLTKHDDTPIPVTTSPKASWSVRGGPVKASLEVAEADDLLLSEVRCFDENGLGWHGWVWDAPKNGEVTAIGSAAPLSMVRKANMYCTTSTSAWKPGMKYNPLNVPNLAPLEVDGPLIRFPLSDTDRDYGAASGGSFQVYIDVPVTRSGKLTFSWSRPSTEWTIMARGTNGLGSSAGGDWSSPSSGLTGTATVTISNTSINVIAFEIIAFNQGVYIPAAPTSITITNPVVYGSSLSPVTPHGIIRKVLGDLPSWAFPTGAAYLSWIEESAVVIAPFMPEWKSDTQVIAEAISYDSMDYYWERAFVGMEQRFVPYYQARETTASLAVDLTRADGDFTETDMESLASAVLVKYRDADGRSKATVVTDTDESHYLVRLGVVSYAEISVDTSSDSLARSLGQLALAELGASTARGSVTTDYLRSATGCPLPLSEARVGRVLDMGERQSRITAVERSGESVKLTLDEAPYRLATALAQLTIRTQ